jgi:hypothetical protein
MFLFDLLLFFNRVLCVFVSIIVFVVGSIVRSLQVNIFFFLMCTCLSISFVRSLLTLLGLLLNYLCLCLVYCWVFGAMQHAHVFPLFYVYVCHYIQVCLNLCNVHCLCMWITIRFYQPWLFFKNLTQ